MRGHAHGWVWTLALMPALGCASAPTQRPAETEEQVMTDAPDEDPAIDPATEPGPPRALAALTGEPSEEDPGVSESVLGAAPAPTVADALVEPTGAVPDEQLVGRWELHGAVPSGPAPGQAGRPSAGGAIGWMRSYELRADGTFQMSAYPPLSLRGRWRRVGATGARVELVHEQLRDPDGTPRVVPARGLGLPGEPLSVLEVQAERYPRVP